MMFSRQVHLALFGTYDLPVVNITAQCRCRDVVTPAEARGLPPFAVLLNAIALTSLATTSWK